MRQLAAVILLFVFIVGTGCSAPAPTWRSKASDLVNDLGRDGGRSYFPQEYQNLAETFEHGEAILHVRKDDKEADALYLLVLQKGVVLREELRLLKEMKKEEQRRLAAELAARMLEEKLMREAAETEERLRMEEQKQAEEDEALQKARTAKEAVTVRPAFYTVRRGETLPQIAARNEIYNDSSLWPIIYRANRDQIRDPKHLWPGQNLKIPRNFSHVEVVEAKRFSLKGPQ